MVVITLLYFLSLLTMVLAVIQESRTTRTCEGCNILPADTWASNVGSAPTSSILIPEVVPTTVETVEDWLSIGCYNDQGGAFNTLVHPVNIQSITIESCTSTCFIAGYPFAGTEHSDQCFCGPVIANGAALTPIEECNYVCSGNSAEFCGGLQRMNVYNYTGEDRPATVGVTPPVQGGPINTAPQPVLFGLPEDWAYEGCYIDNAHGRIFEQALGGRSDNAIHSCINACIERGYAVAGSEFGAECFCGDRLVNGAAATEESSCSMRCAANLTHACGGPNRLSVYSTFDDLPILPVPSVKTTGLPGKWVYKGCYTDVAESRLLSWQIVDEHHNTPEKCLKRCAQYGYDAAGLQYGQECYCGDATTIISNGGAKVPESQCTTRCSGDPTSICGGGLRHTMYIWADVMNVWHRPEVAGHYEFLVPGLIVPLLITVGINNKVTFLEKWGTGAPNSTGAYELDLSLVGSRNWTDAWREMHLKTDVFCSGSIILPDKAGRQINVGGWSGESTFGVRLFTPDGSPGNLSRNDWEENWKDLSLQRGRWYPTAAMLANGSILVMGGETGSNAAPQPNLEILPRPPGSSVVHLEWLMSSDPFNLYPYIVVLPGGSVFVAYYNEARILDPVTFETIKVLPKSPGAVNSEKGGRTYPLEGAAAILPQHAPYADPLRVLMCGGSTGPGPAHPLDNCVTISPEVDGSEWVIERMPSTRVMPNMVNLPDGTYLIVGGAHEGAAGFGLASSPNLNAVLYDPYKAVNRRFSILNDTIVARMYHSEAALLPDGRVLISGSDPQTDGMPEEHRVEVYVPPYLAGGLTRPTFTIPDTDWAYGHEYTIARVRLAQGSTSTMRVSLVFATSSTHGNTMGARTIMPAFRCVGTICRITAPPNANISPPGWHMLFILDGPTPSHATWVRIGGDPAGLGNWPDLPGFSRPGI